MGSVKSSVDMPFLGGCKKSVDDFGKGWNTSRVHQFLQSPSDDGRKHQAKPFPQFPFFLQSKLEVISK
jgi:hypothetical protein